MDALQIISLHFAIIPYVMALLMPSWRWLAGYAAVVGVLFAALFIHELVVSSSPGYKIGNGLAFALGILWLGSAGVSFIGGVLTRALTLRLRSHGRSLLTCALVSLLGLPTAYGIVLLPEAWHRWVYRRPVDPACLAARTKARIGQTIITVPMAKPFILYTGKSSRSGAYYLGFNKSQREVCAISENGAKVVPATHLWFSLRKANSFEICGTTDNTDFPKEAHLFVPSEVTLGEFGGSPSTYDNSLKPPRRNSASGSVDEFIRSDVLTPDNKPLTFRCGSVSNGRRWCTAAYGLGDGTHIQFSFSAKPEEIVTRGNRVHEGTKLFFLLLEGKALCAAPK